MIATGLLNPRAVTFGPDGLLYVAEAGQGGDQAVTAGAHHIPYQIGRTARVERMSLDGGDVEPVLADLPSVRTPDDVFGATGLAFVGADLYVLTGAGGRDVGDPTYANAVLRVTPDRAVQTVIDLTDLNLRQPPLARQDPRADVEGGVPFGLTALGGRLYATDGNLETVTEVGLDGTTRRLVQYPMSNRVLVGLAPAPDGSLWVAEYGPWPHAPGSARITRVTLDGTATDAWIGLNTAIGIAFGPDGSAYALEFSSGRRQPNTGRVLRRSADGVVSVIAEGLSFPTALAVGPDGALYVAENGHRSEDGSGRVVRLWPQG